MANRVTRPLGIATVSNSFEGAGGIQIGSINRTETQDGVVLEEEWNDSFQPLRKECETGFILFGNVWLGKPLCLQN